MECPESIYKLKRSYKRELYAWGFALVIIATPFILIARPEISGYTLQRDIIAMIVLGLLYHHPGSQFEEWERLVVNKIQGKKPV